MKLSCQVLLYSIQMKMVVPHMNYKQTISTPIKDSQFKCFSFFFFNFACLFFVFGCPITCQLQSHYSHAAHPAIPSPSKETISTCIKDSQFQCFSFCLIFVSLFVSWCFGLSLHRCWLQSHYSHAAHPGIPTSSKEISTWVKDSQF